jgi:hypothetical protein
VIDPLDDWLSSAVIITTADAITWWTGMEATGHPLARMALNFLLFPVSTHQYLIAVGL